MHITAPSQRLRRSFRDTATAIAGLVLAGSCLFTTLLLAADGKPHAGAAMATPPTVTPDPANGPVAATVALPRFVPAPDAVEILPGTDIQSIVDQHKEGTAFLLEEGCPQAAVHCSQERHVVLW